MYIMYICILCILCIYVYGVFCYVIIDIDIIHPLYKYIRYLTCVIVGILFFYRYDVKQKFT